MAVIIRETTVENGIVTVKEVIDDNVNITPKRHRLDNGNWIVIFQNALKTIAVDSNFSKGAYRVLLYLIAETEVTNDVKMPIQQVAEALKEDKGNIYRFLKELEEFNIIIRDKKTKYIRLNYDLAYKGKFSNYKHVQFKDTPLLEKKPKNQLNFIQVEE